MTSVESILEEFDKVEKLYEELLTKTGSDLQHATAIDLRALSATCYEALAENLPASSPHVFVAKQIVSGNHSARDTAEGLLGTVRAARTLVQDEGYAPADEVEYFESYSMFSKLLRHWFIAFGVGGPAALVAQDALFQRLSASGVVDFVLIAFLLGVGIQVSKALVYKAASWFAMDYNYKPEEDLNRLAKASRWLGNDMAVDLFLDVLTIVAFVIAAVTAVRAL